jgi:hypothetical protein
MDGALKGSCREAGVELLIVYPRKEEQGGRQGDRLPVSLRESGGPLKQGGALHEVARQLLDSSEIASRCDHAVDIAEVLADAQSAAQVGACGVQLAPLLRDDSHVAVDSSEKSGCPPYPCCPACPHQGHLRSCGGSLQELRLSFNHQELRDDPRSGGAMSS